MRDHAAETAAAEFTGWFEAQNYTDSHFGLDDMRDAFTAGMEAAAHLAAVGSGSLRERITHLAQTWESNPHLTEAGQLLRDLGQILRDELAYASETRS